MTCVTIFFRRYGVVLPPFVLISLFSFSAVIVSPRYPERLMSEDL